jgi:hypothetical protein
MTRTWERTPGSYLIAACAEIRFTDGKDAIWRPNDA